MRIFQALYGQNMSDPPEDQRNNNNGKNTVRSSDRRGVAVSETPEVVLTAVGQDIIDTDKLKAENVRLRKRCRSSEFHLQQERKKVLLLSGALNSIENLASATLCPDNGVERVLSQN
jgi:hypothetical protein